jgi:hypothetical protein
MEEQHVLEESVPEEVIVSMHATSNNPLSNTMCFKDQLVIL